jgi:hypothetical protein
MSDKTIMLIIGVIAGLLLSCISGLLMLATAPSKPTTVSAGPPAGAVIEAAIAESYLNRTFAENVAGGGAKSPVLDGRVDILPGNRLKFVAQLDTPLGPFTTSGAITIAVRDGQLKFHVAEVRAGQVPVTLLASPFLPAIEAQINEQANRQLAERSAQAKVKLLGVTSDETQLKFFLAGK